MASVEMYQIRNIVPNDIALDLPNCMYKMKNIHFSNGKGQTLPSSNTIASIADQEISSPDLVMIENRQKKILTQLEELQQQLLKIKSFIKLDQPNQIVSPASSSPKIKVVMSELPDILIRADPLNPPHSLLFVQRALRNHCRFALTSHVHSTIRKLPECAENWIRSFNTNNVDDNTRHVVNIRLIWKENKMNQMETVVDNAWIFGEVNLLRYLARTLPNLKYEQCGISSVDFILDTIYNLKRENTREVRRSYEKTLAAHLSKSGSFLCGSELCIADIAAWSALRQSKDLDLNLTKWLNKCENLLLA